MAARARTSPPARLLVRPDNWSARHRKLWQAGTDPGNVDDDDNPPYGCTLSEATLRNVRDGWGRFLATLPLGRAKVGDPAGMVNPGAIRDFIAALKEVDNSKSTIASRLWEVRTALGIMCPGEDFLWMTSPGGVSARSYFRDQTPRRPAKVHDSRLLYELGLSLMDNANKADTPRQRAKLFRDGLLVAIFASRAPRLRSMAACRIGIHLLEGPDGYRLAFSKADLKTGGFQEYPLPAGLTAYVRRYLDVERPVLLHGQDHDWLWVGQQGARLREDGISGMLRRLSEETGLDFSAHSFRHAMGTTAPMADPEHPAMASVLMGNSERVATRHYNLGKQVDAALKYQEAVREERQKSAPLARKAFKRR